MTTDLAMSILFDPDGFWPQSFHAEARKAVEQNGSKEQKAALGKETIVKEGNGKRLSSAVAETNFGNRRMGFLL